MTALTHIVDLSDRVRAALPWPLQQMERLSGLARAIGSALQDAEDLMWDLLEQLDLDGATASGHRLDLVGRIIGLSRAWADDPTYRTLIRYWAMGSWAHGVIGHLAHILRVAMDGQGDLEYRHVDAAPCDCVFVIRYGAGETPMDETTRQAATAGVKRGSPAGTGVTWWWQQTGSHLVLDGLTTWDSGYTWSQLGGSSYEE